MFLNVFIVTFVGIAAHNPENYQENRGLSGVHLKVAIYHEPPVFSIIRDPTNSSVVNYIGFPKIVFDLLAASQNFTYSFVEVTPTMVQQIGSIDGALIDQLLTKGADIDGRLISPTAERLEYMDFTAAVSVYQFALIQPMPQIHNRFLAPIKPYQPTVWYFIFAAFVATVLTLTMTNRGQKSTRQIQNPMKIRAVARNALFAFEVLMSQGAHLKSKRLALRFMAGTWCLISIVIVYAYNSTLISYISVPRYDPVVNTWSDLANSKTLRVTAPRGGLFADIILKSKTGVLKILGDSLRKNPNDLLLTLPGELDRVLHSGCCAYVEVRRLGEILVYQSMMRHHGECKLTIGNDLDYSQVWSFGAAKNLPHLSSINRGILLLRQFGLFSQMRSSYFGSIDKCRAQQGVRPKNSKLNLYDLASAFYVLGLGCCLSVFLFFLEVMKTLFRCIGAARHAVSQQNV